MGEARFGMAKQTLFGCLAVLLIAGSLANTSQVICSKTLRKFFIHIAAGTECRGSTCSADCQALIDTSMDACAGMMVPNTQVDFDPAGIDQMKSAVNLDIPSECDWTCYACEHLTSASASRRLSSYDNRQHLNNLREAARRDPSGLIADSTTPPVAAVDSSTLKTGIPDKSVPEAPLVPDAAVPEPKSVPQPKSSAEVHTELEGCRDTMDSCAEWAAEGECGSNEPFMVVRCCQSCLRHSQKLGDESCKDTHPECESWAADGECATNAAFMLPTCCHSCVSKLQAALKAGAKSIEDSAADL